MKIILFATLTALTGSPRQSPITTIKELRESLNKATPGTRIEIAPGVYEGGVSAGNLRGSASKPIVICASDPQKPPVLKSSGTGLHLSGAEYIELRDIAFEECTSNGLNIDDAGVVEKPSHHITLLNLKISKTGSKGNQDGLKLSGVDDFRVANCVIDQWGTGGGSAIDMVGCHRGVIENSTFKGNTDGGTGVQTKGGSSDITIRGNRFENAGVRAVNVGGSTGKEYFRPALKKPPYVEARNITVEGNTILGSQASIAFVGVDGAIVRFNTIYSPGKWVIRILQESADPEFTKCRAGQFTDNIIAFQSTQWSEGGVNLGPNTDPSTFTFARNFWYSIDSPSRSKPKLPTEEKDGVYGKNPLFKDPQKGILQLEKDSPALAAGAGAWKR